MPASLHFSNSLDALAERLITNLNGSGGDPFATAAIATPASALRDWLKVRIAEKTGITANIAFPHLENLLWERLAERDRFRDVEDRQPARLLDSFSFQGLVLAQLRRDPPAELTEYLRTGNAGEDARRICQLSGKLSSLFREYEYSRVTENGRSGLAESWMRGERCFERFANHPDVPELEGWQMKIYRALFRKDAGLRDLWGAQTKTYRYTLPQYAEMVLAEGETAKRTEPPGPATTPTLFHLFGLSNISPFHRDLIGRLSDVNTLGDRAAHFTIYALNPCAEFWEDALTDRERQARATRRTAGRMDPRRIEEARPSRAEIENGEIAELENENGLLTLFGKPGRETIKLWCQLTGHDFHEDFRNPRGETLLATVQKSILSRLGKLPFENGEGEGEGEGDGDAPVKRRPADASLRIRSAPDPRSELEAVRAEAAALLRKHPDLRPEDMAIIPANPEAALPRIRAVFAGGREIPGNVPVLLPGADNAADSPLLRGFRDLLSPGVLGADRNALLALLENPTVSQKAGLGADRLRAVRGFLESAGFQEGWETPGAQGAAAEGSTARAAEERALLALVLDPRDAALEAAGLWPARDRTGLLDREESAHLITWLSGLREALRPFRAASTDATGAAGATGAVEHSFGEWAEILRALLDGFLQPEEDNAADKRAELDLRRLFAEMEQWDRWSETPDTVSGELVRTLLEDAFRDPGTPKAAFLRGGVRVGGLSALRGIPFRHVWVTGLATGEFPASGEAAPLDLRGYRRLPGENDPAARDLYALLEVIASATESLTLSWTRRDAGRNAEVPPSRALNGIKAWIESDILTDAVLPVEALRAAGLPPPRNASPSSRLEAPHPATWTDATRQEGQPPGLVQWTHVTDYLKNPAVHAAKIHFGLRPYDALDFEEEERASILFLDDRADAALLDPILRAELLQPGTAVQVFTRLWNERAHGGLLPPPPYEGIEHERLLAEVTGSLSAQAAHLRDILLNHKLEFLGSLRVGPQDAQMADPPVVSIPAFDAQRIGVPMLLGGILPWFFRGSGSAAGWALMVDEGAEIPAYLLQLCIASLPAEAVPELLRGQGHVILRKKKTGKANRIHSIYSIHGLPEQEAAEAAGRLRALLTDLAAAPCFDDLPLDGIEALQEQAETKHEGVEEWGQAIEAWRREEEEKRFGGPKFWDRMLGTFGVGVPRDAGLVIARRILPYLEWKRAWHPRKRKRAAGDAESDTEGMAEESA